LRYKKEKVICESISKEKWKNDLPESPVMVFDREGSGVKFFSKLVSNKIWVVLNK
jgi:hypothetical protein